MFKNFHIVILVILFLAILNTSVENFGWGWWGSFAVRRASNIDSSCASRCKTRGNKWARNSYLDYWNQKCASCICKSGRKYWHYGTAYCS